MSSGGDNHDGRTVGDRSSAHVALDTIGPERVDDVEVLLRRPRLTDGPAWRRVRLADESRLRPAFGDPSASWDVQSSLTAWAERVGELRAAARVGSAMPLVIATTSDDVLGECVFSIDARSGLAELSLWTARGVSRAVTTWATVIGVLRVLEHPRDVPWVVAPVAAPNPGPARLLAEAGFESSGTARLLRPYGGTPTDHTIWRLENTPQTRDRLRALLDRGLSPARRAEQKNRL
jgi:RimJ/RimL family protein N-acetyltransferase